MNPEGIYACKVVSRRFLKSAVSFCAIIILKTAVLPCKTDRNVKPGAEYNNSCNPEAPPEQAGCLFTYMKIYYYAPKPIKTVKDNEGKEAKVKGNPTG